jgi:putative hydrolase of the HAD superfamily
VERSLTVVFDLGDVLVPSAGVLPVLAAELGASRAEFEAAYWPPRSAYDLGGDPDVYWTAVLTMLGQEPEPAQLRRLCALDALMWAEIPPSTERLLAELAGTQLAVLSNAPKPLAAAVRAAAWSKAVDAFVFSAELGRIKPDPRIYAEADALLGTTSDEVLFFDDRAENVAAARRHGWDAHVWIDPSTALAVLGARGVPGPR